MEHLGLLRRKIFERATKIKRTGELMAHREDLEAIFTKHGFTDFKWIDPEKIVVSNWVRMKCKFGCPEYGKAAACPPNTLSVSECKEFFREYKDAVIFHFEKKVDKPEDRHAWTAGINANLTKVELFARSKTPLLPTDWDVWGNEVESDVEIRTKEKNTK